MNGIAGFLNLNKPSGWTSHDCVAKVRRLVKCKKVGHGGTLDPAAQGVLPIAVGRATRLLQYLSGQKAYRGIIRFGLTTSTDDLEGEVLTETPASHLDLETVSAVLPKFLGTIDQIPPRYSAIQIQGQRLYDLARSQKTFDIPSRQVTIHRLDILRWQPGAFPELEVAIACGSGTYIRSIARDWGAILGVGATLAQLIRTESGGFLLENSLSFADLEQQIANQTLQLLEPALALGHLPVVTLEPELAQRWCQGQKLAWEPAWEPEQPSQTRDPSTSILRIQCQGHFLGIAERQENGENALVLAPKVVFRT